MLGCKVLYFVIDLTRSARPLYIRKMDFSLLFCRLFRGVFSTKRMFVDCLLHTLLSYDAWRIYLIFLFFPIFFFTYFFSSWFLFDPWFLSFLLFFRSWSEQGLDRFFVQKQRSSLLYVDKCKCLMVDNTAQNKTYVCNERIFDSRPFM